MQAFNLSTEETELCELKISLVYSVFQAPQSHLVTPCLKNLKAKYREMEKPKNKGEGREQKRAGGHRTLVLLLVAVFQLQGSTRL